MKLGARQRYWKNEENMCMGSHLLTLAEDNTKRTKCTYIEQGSEKVDPCRRD
jgi:hypothetical protein